MTGTIQEFRGTIIKIPGNEPGLILANGKQWPFGMEGVWVSPIAPAANQTVEVTLDAAGAIAKIQVIDEPQVAREKFNQFAGAASERGQQAATMGKAKLSILVDRMGYPLLITTLVLWIAWFFMTSVQINPRLGSQSFNFFELPGLSFSLLLGTAESHVKFWSLLGLLSIAAPWAAPWAASWIGQRRTPLLNIAPLVYALPTYIIFKGQVFNALSNYGNEANFFGRRGTPAGFAEEGAARAAEIVATGAGMSVVMLAALVLAALGFVRYRSRRAAAIHVD